MALALVMTTRTESTLMLKATFGKSPQGSFASYQLSVTEDNFKVFCDTTSVTRLDPDSLNDLQITVFPRFPLDQSNKKF